VEEAELNQDLRIKYLRNELSEEAFKLSLQRADKKRLKQNEKNQVLELLSTVARDIAERVIQFLLSNKNVVTEQLSTFFVEMENLRLHCNTLFDDISHTYSSKTYRLKENMFFS
jgi:hypothetical protein